MTFRERTTITRLAGAIMITQFLLSLWLPAGHFSALYPEAEIDGFHRSGIWFALGGRVTHSDRLRSPF